MIRLERLHPARLVEYWACVPAGEPAPRWITPTGTALTESEQVVPGELEALLEGGELGARSRPWRDSGAGVELTFAAPPRVGVLSGLAEGELAIAVDGAQDRAVAAAVGTMGKLAAALGVARRPEGGRGGEIVAAAFRHHSTAFGEPSLHDHVVVLLPGCEGRLRGAMGCAGLLVAGVLAGPLYSLRLRRELRAVDGVAGIRLSKEVLGALAPPYRQRRRRPAAVPADTAPGQLVTIDQLRRSWAAAAKRDTGGERHCRQPSGPGGHEGGGG